MQKTSRIVIDQILHSDIDPSVGSFVKEIEYVVKVDEEVAYREKATYPIKSKSGLYDFIEWLNGKDRKIPKEEIIQTVLESIEAVPDL